MSPVTSPNILNLMGGRLGPFEHTVNSGTNPMKDVITVTDEGSVSGSVGESSIERIFEPSSRNIEIRRPNDFLPNLDTKLKGRHSKLVNLYTGANNNKITKVGQYIDFR